MKRFLGFRFLALFFLFCISATAQKNVQSSFTIVPLGVKGGLDESNLSAYLAAPAGTDNYICLDAGTLHYGIEKAIANKVFIEDAAKVLRTNIKGYLISHGHLDHLAGLVINSPDDTVKNIYAMPYVIDVLKTKYFTWQSWANFANEGDQPALKKYQYITLSEGNETVLTNTGMTVKPFILSHSSPYQSTAFLLNNKGNFLLYLGDTGPDSIEHSLKLTMLWQQVAPLIKSGNLKGIFIEVSFPNEQPDGQLFGHLTPKWLMMEMTILSKLSGNAALKKVPIIITHMKPTGDSEAVIKKQLMSQNNFELQLIFPEQGKRISL